MAGPEPLLQWSSQFEFSPATGSATLPGDKISLPPSALEGLLEASTKLAAERARRDLPAFDPYNSSTYSAYRRTESEIQDQRQQLPYPLTFRLVNPENGRVVYAGIREFTAEDNQIVLSEFLQDALGLVEKDVGSHETTLEATASPKAVTVHIQELPKGTFVKLRPLEAGYDPDDWKALLEQHLRQNYTTMTKGEILFVPGPRTVGGKREEYRFLVDGFKPEHDGVCIVDTDLEVDIEALNEEQARETLAQIAAKMTRKPGSEQGSSPGGELDIVRPQSGRVLPGEYVDYELTSWDRSQVLEVEVSCEDDRDLNLLVNPFTATLRTKPRLDEHAFAVFDNRPTKRIRLDPTNSFIKDAEALYVSVYSFEEIDLGRSADRAAATFTLRATHPSPSMDRSGGESEERPPNEGEVRCTNCGQWVPQRTLMLHQNFCLRNNILCPKGCGQVFQKRSAEYERHWHCPYDEEFGATETARSKHNHIHHPAEILRCPDCSTAETFANLPSLAHHRTTTCPAKLILCRFCHLEVPQDGDPDIPNAEAILSGLTPHELADGARTTECHLCSRIVKLRDMETHLKNHDLERLSRPMPRVCRNVNCGRTLDVCSPSGDTRAGTRMGQGPGNDIDLCSVCFGPLYVSMYDPENKALRRRIERRYLQQLLTGCNKPWCRNEFCKAGRAHLDMPGDVTTKDALPMVKPFLDGAVVASARTPLHFCVDEASQNRRSLAVMLAAQTNGTINHGGFAFEWCVGALEAMNGNLDEAQQWLKNWAPNKAEN